MEREALEVGCVYFAPERRWVALQISFFEGNKNPTSPLENEAFLFLGFGKGVQFNAYGKFFRLKTQTVVYFFETSLRYLLDPRGESARTKE